MKIIQPQDLQAADLPGLESPFFALEKARSFIQNDPNLNLERLLGRPATYGLGARAFKEQRNTHIENVLRLFLNTASDPSWSKLAENDVFGGWVCKILGFSKMHF